LLFGLLFFIKQKRRLSPYASWLTTSLNTLWESPRRKARSQCVLIARYIPRWWFRGALS